MKSNRSLLQVTPAAILLTACYTQVPLQRSVPEPATRIVAQVTDTGTVSMGNAIGPGAREVEGVVATADASVWNLHLVRVDQLGGASTLWNRELVSFPRNALVNPTIKRLDKPRSLLAGVVVAAGAFAAARLFTALGADDDPGTDPTPQQIRIPGGR